MPVFGKVTNQQAVIFDGADPETADPARPESDG
jgi:hypothetical protein